ncbi:MAG: calcium-binding protein [Moorea sp. SIO2B7]|nr:calcium-binding protein [Moorena sp. SIO2B7]
MFSDVDGDEISFSVFANSNEGLVTASIVNNELSLDYLQNQSGIADITIRGTSNSKFVHETFSVTVNPVDDAPIVENAIAPVEVDEDADNTLINLANVFSDVDGDEISFSVFANSNTSLVTASIIDNELSLDYLQNQSGIADITIRGTSNSKFVDTTFNITINPVDPDLVGSSFELVPETINAGDSVTINYELTNLIDEATQPFNSSFYLSNDSNIDSNDYLLGEVRNTSGLTGNTTQSYQNTFTLPGFNDAYWTNGDDTYYIGIIIDSDNEIFEVNEDNNNNYDNVVINNTQLLGTDEDDILIGSPGNDIISGLRDDDDIFGAQGNDLLRGDRGDDNLYGEAGDDTLEGNRGDDFIFGGIGNDNLLGDRGDDILWGIDLNDTNPGSGEIDNLSGGRGFDIFVLGDTEQAYYNNAGTEDYALITDFNSSFDEIELYGSAVDYQLGNISSSLPTGIGIFLNTNELIGIVQGENTLDLNSSYFSYV